MRLPKVLRVSQALHAQDRLYEQFARQDFSSAPLGTWRPAAPHARQQVSIGGNPHTDLIPKTDNRTTAQVIADMVQGK